MDRTGGGRRGVGRGDPRDALIEHVLGWLAGLPALAVYAVIAGFATVENIFPPAPADVVVALGAFLSHRGLTSPWTVFLVTWTFNVGGAALVYAVARRYGEGFLSTGLGRRLMSPHAVQFIEREYLRFGLWGILLARMLPGVRSFVAPFTGVIRLSPIRALGPVAVASAIWYGGIVLAASMLGASWSTIAETLGSLNRGLYILVGILAVAGLGWWLVRRRRERASDAWKLIEQAFGQRGSGPIDQEQTGRLAAATLLAEVASGDARLSPDDAMLVSQYLEERWGLNEEVRPLRSLRDPERFPKLAGRIRDDYLLSERLNLLERCWTLVLGDDRLLPHEKELMGRVGTLLGLEPDDIAASAERARRMRAADGG